MTTLLLQTGVMKWVKASQVMFAIVLLTEDSNVRLVEGLNYLGRLDKLGNGLWPRLKLLWLNLDNQNTQSCRYYTHNFSAPMYESENDI